MSAVIIDGEIRLISSLNEEEMELLYELYRQEDELDIQAE